MPVAGADRFLWLSNEAPPRGFREVPASGFCVCAFLFVRRGADILLGKYAEDPRWESLTGLDPERVRVHAQGWTVPASHLVFGEDPGKAGRRIAEAILGLPGLGMTEPRVEASFEVHPRFPHRGHHYDIWFFLEARVPDGTEVARPPWYRELSWQDPAKLPDGAYARSHGDVVARWLGR